MKRTLRTIRPVAAVAALLTSSACRSDSLTDPVEAVGHLIALDSLRTLDGQGLPTATLDGGTLTFYAAASYTDTVFTPAGPMSGACVQGVPNGAHIGRNGLVTLPDSSTYLLLPCSRGTFAIVLTRRVAMTDGSPRTEQDTLSHGLFQYRDVFDPADVSGHGHDVGGTARRYRRYPGFGFGETVGAQIGDTDFHPKTSEPHGSGKAYTGRASCDNGDVVRRHGGVRHLSSPDAKELPSLNIELCRCGALARLETAWEVFVTAICSPRCRLLRAGRTGYISRLRNR